MGHGKELRVKMGGTWGKSAEREGGRADVAAVEEARGGEFQKNIITDDSNRKSPLFMDANFEGRKASTVVNQRGGGESMGGGLANHHSLRQTLKARAICGEEAAAHNCRRREGKGAIELGSIFGSRGKGDFEGTREA